MNSKKFLPRSDTEFHEGRIHLKTPCTSVPFVVNILFLLVLLFNTGFASCSSQKQKLKTTVLSIERENAPPVELTVEIAQTDEERALGLMFRKKLPDGEGMLFVFDRDQQLSFWMKNTIIPLSIAYITSDGRIHEIKDMVPNDINSVTSSRSVRYALEVPQGWFDRVNVRPGALVNADTSMVNNR